MRTTNILLAFTALVVFSFAACKKDPPTTSELLTDHAWKILDKKKDAAAVTVEDCEKDDVYTFVTAGTFSVENGVKKCNSNDPQLVNGNWQLVNGDTGIKTSFSVGTASGEITYTIKEITADKLVVTYTSIEGIGKTVTVELTFDVYKK